MQEAVEVGCGRITVFKALRSEPEIAGEFLGDSRVMFLLERPFADKPGKQRERMRSKKMKTIVDRRRTILPPLAALPSGSNELMPLRDDARDEDDRRQTTHYTAAIGGVSVREQ